MNQKEYFHRIGIEKTEIYADLASLNFLQHQHLLHIPFENLDIHWQRPIILDTDKFYRKIVEEKRGGFCYELNGLFFKLLENVDFNGKKILIIGDGKLVGRPLSKSLKNSGYDVTVADRSTIDLTKLTLQSDIIITATGRPAIIYPNMLKQGAVVVDAGVASEDGKIVGDLDETVYERDDLTITPQKGGVGPLTICALFENVINFALKTTD